MGLFDSKKKDLEIKSLKAENARLRFLCEEKDKFFAEVISDGLRHGSKLASKHMHDLNDYKHGKIGG